MATRGRAKIAIDQGVSVWLLEANEGFGDSEFHAHHAIQLTACLGGFLALEGPNSMLSGEILAVAPDTPHKLEASGLLAIVFVEPESATGRALLETLFGDQSLTVVESAQFMTLLEPLRSGFDPEFAKHRMIAVGRHAIGALVPHRTVPAADPRVERIIACAQAHLDLSLTQAAEAAGVYLSGDRLRHVFVEHTGLPFKTYMVWLRLVRAVRLYADGQTLTEAAHAAGFADSAHFSRAFKRTFGAPATTLRRL